MSNLVKQISDQYKMTARQITERIAEETGKVYNWRHISAVMRGTAPVSDTLEIFLIQAFGEKNLSGELTDVE